MPFDLSGLGPAPAPEMVPPTGAMSAPDVSGLATSSSPIKPAMLPAGENTPHAGLMRMLEGLASVGVGISAAGKALGSGGREGGAADVAAYEQQQQEMGLRAKQEARNQQEFETRNKMMVAQSAMYQVQAERAKLLLPGEVQAQHNSIDKESVDLYKEVGLDPLFALDHTPGQSIEQHGNELLKSAEEHGGATSAMFVPVQSGDHGQGGTTFAYSVKSLAAKQIPMEMYAPKLNALKTAVSGAAGILGKDDPNVQKAQSIVEALSGASQVNALDDRNLTMLIQGTLVPAMAQKKQQLDFQKEQAAAAKEASDAKTAAETAKNAPVKQAAELAGVQLGNTEKRVNIAKGKEELKQMQGMDNLTDPFGVPVGRTANGITMNRKEYDSSQKTFSKEYVQPLTVLEKTTMEFNRINSNPNQTGAERVTALLNAVGISGDPLKGKGFRINNQIVQEHAQARNIWEGAVQKLNTIAGTGGPITSKQISDYTAVAQGVVHDAYVTAAQEARRQGLPVDFLPKATAKQQAADHLTAKIYLDSASGDINSAHKAMIAAGFQE